MNLYNPIKYSVALTGILSGIYYVVNRVTKAAYEKDLLIEGVSSYNKNMGNVLEVLQKGILLKEYVMPNDNTIINIVSKFNKTASNKICAFKEYSLAKDNYNKFYETSDFDYLSKASNNLTSAGVCSKNIILEKLEISWDNMYKTVEHFFEYHDL